MKAVQYRTFGGPEVLEVVDIPEPKTFSDFVLVRIEAAGLNPADLAYQSGAADSLVDALAWAPARRHPALDGFLSVAKNGNWNTRDE